MTNKDLTIEAKNMEIVMLHINQAINDIIRMEVNNDTWLNIHNKLTSLWSITKVFKVEHIEHIRTMLEEFNGKEMFMSDRLEEEIIEEEEYQVDYEPEKDWDVIDINYEPEVTDKGVLAL